MAALILPAGASARATWLCRPGLLGNPCAAGLSTTRFSPAGVDLGVEHVRAPRQTGVDCFYVYPTVSQQPTPYANLHVDPEERSIALFEAARYAQYCRVFAPMYRQVTIAELSRTGGEIAAQLATPLTDVRRAFRDYLKHDNHGRGIVLIGHSQGAFLLRGLIKADGNVLRIAPRAGAPQFTPSPTAVWGLHLADASIALGNLVDLVRKQGLAWANHNRR
ncbi:MAG: hypothetical protein NVSMB51_14760 [Solirubrobacteraceae bacterium]